MSPWVESAQSPNPATFVNPPAPRQSPTSPLTCLAYDLYTGKYLGRIPLSGLSFGSQLLSPGSCSGSIDIASSAVAALGPLGASAPARTMLALDYLGALIWAGVIWPRNYDYDNVTRKLTLTATECWSYPAARVQATDYSAPPYSGLSGPVKMAIWNASNSDAAGVYDPVLIAWQLLSDALTQVRYGNILGGLAIAANGFTSAAAYLASGTQTPLGDYLSINYPYASLQSLGSIVSQLASNGLGVGFDYAVDVAYTAGPGSVPVGTVNLSYPRRGRSYAQNRLVLHCGRAISYSAPEDGAQAANTIYEQGSSQALVISQNLAPLQGGYPVLETMKSRSSIQSANILNVLTTLGLSDLFQLSYPPVTPTVTMDLFDSPVPLGEFVVGDDCRWVIPASDGMGGVLDPRFPNGVDQEWRIVGYSAQVPDAGQAKLTFNLAAPPAVSVGGPAL